MRDFLRRLVLALGGRPPGVPQTSARGRHHAAAVGTDAVTAGVLVARLVTERSSRTAARMPREADAEEPASLPRVSLTTHAPEGYASPWPPLTLVARPVTALTPPDLRWRQPVTVRPRQASAGRHAQPMAVAA